MNLRKFVSPEIVFGIGARVLAGQFAHQYSARKVLLVTDKNLLGMRWVEEVRKDLESHEIEYSIFSDISPNPRAGEVHKGAEKYLSENCNVIIAVGGGSPMDCAKGIGIVSSNNRPILEFEGVDNIEHPVPPLIFIPTTAGSSADVSQFCIIADEEKKLKTAIVSKAIVPDVALIDPLTTTTMDPYLTACTGMDALVHAFEAYASTGCGDLTDHYALESIKNTTAGLFPLMKDPKNPDLRAKQMLASMQAGLAFSNAILGAVHALAHSLGGFLDLPHGECNALLLEHVVDYNFDSIPDRYISIANAMNISTESKKRDDIKDALCRELKELRYSLGIKDGLAARGVKEGDLEKLARFAIKDACLLTNPKAAGPDELMTILKKAM